MFKTIGYDPNGIPRVWATDDYEQTSEGFCREEATTYVAGRPDTAPIDGWRFHTILND